MPDQPSVVIVKAFTYRGAVEEWSNKYHFSGTIPSTAAEWKALVDAIKGAESLCVSSATSFVRAYGYEPGSDRKGGHADAVIDYTVSPNVIINGSLTVSSTAWMPGDAAATIRWQTPDFNERGKRIYCRKYFHDVYTATNAKDLLLPAQRTAMGTFAAKMIDGTLPGSARYCGPQGAVLSVPVVSQWITTRTLKRRGKRPPLAGSGA